MRWLLHSEQNKRTAPTLVRLCAMSYCYILHWLNHFINATAAFGNCLQHVLQVYGKQVTMQTLAQQFAYTLASDQLLTGSSSMFTTSFSSTSTSVYDDKALAPGLGLSSCRCNNANNQMLQYTVFEDQGADQQFQFGHHHSDAWKFKSAVSSIPWEKLQNDSTHEDWGPH